MSVVPAMSVMHLLLFTIHFIKSLRFQHNLHHQTIPNMYLISHLFHATGWTENALNSMKRTKDTQRTKNLKKQPNNDDDDDDDKKKNKSAILNLLLFVRLTLTRHFRQFNSVLHSFGLCTCRAYNLLLVSENIFCCVCVWMLNVIRCRCLMWICLLTRRSLSSN